MRDFLTGAVRFLALLAGLGSALCSGLALAGVVSPHADIFSHFVPVWAAAGLFALVLGAWTRARRAALLGLVGVILAGCLVVPELLSVRPAPRIAQPALRVIQFNVFYLNEDPAATAAWIAGQNADVVVLQEASAERSQQVIRAIRGRFPYASPCAATWCDVTVMSARPPVSSGELPGRSGTKESAGAWMTVQTPAGPSTVIGVHLVWPIWTRALDAQIRSVAQATRRLPRERMVLVGDMNITAWSFALRRLERETGLRRQSRATLTWPVRPFYGQLPAYFRYAPWNLPFAYMPLDHVLAEPGWSAVSVRRGPRLGSDHLPLVVDLQAARR